MKKPFVVLTAVALSLGARLTSAGIKMEFEHKGPKDEKPTTGSIELEADRMRMETAGQSVIFRADKQVMWVLQPHEKSYMELTKEQAKKTADMIEEQMKNVPPEQRAMIEKMMKGKMGGDAAAKPEEPAEIKKIGKTETIAGFPCVSYEARRGDKVEREMWITDWKRFNLTAKDFAVFEQFAEFMKSMMGPMAKRVGADLAQKYSDEEKPGSLPGVPIRTVSFGDHGKSVQEITKIAREDIPAARFEVPAGLEKKDMMSGMGGHRRGE